MPKNGGFENIFMARREKHNSIYINDLTTRYNALQSILKIF